ncbi:MAG: hypothetical protein QXK07_07100 [Desulfurococcaceae archaeon]
MAVRMEELQKKILDLVVDGAGIYIGDKIVEFAKPYTQKTLKQYNDIVVKLGLSMLDLVFPRIRDIPYLGDWISLWGRTGVRDAVRLFIDKPPVCWALDANTIECVNFDTTSISVKINGQLITDFTVEGSADEFKIHLATALSTGAYDLVVVGNTKAFSGKIYV